MSTNTIAPTAQKERIGALDILRGYALFMILVGNLQTIRVPYFTPGYVVEQAVTLPDKIAYFIMYNLLGTELYLVFSFLFGLGFAVQIMRAESKGVQGYALFLRRMGGLFIIGCLHYILIWDGDILRVYAIFGCVLLLFNKLPNRALIVGAVLLLLVSPLATRVMDTVHIFDSDTSGDVLAHVRAIYSTGSYFDVVSYRLTNFLSDTWAYLTYDGFNIMSMFMLGMFVGRIRVFENLDKYRNWLFIGILIGLGAAVGSEILTNINEDLSFDIVHRGGMAMLHVLVITVLTTFPWWKEKLSVLIPFGRLSLSNYIMQSVIATTIFYGYGFGQFEKMSHAAALILAITIGVLQVAFSYWWLKRFNFGPLEWLWRSLMYRKFQPLRKADEPETEPAPAIKPT